MSTRTDVYRRRIANLPDHSRREIDIAADQLTMLHAAFNTGSLDIDLLRMSKEDLLKIMESIDAMSLEEMRSGWMFEPPFDSGDPEGWLRQAKDIRLNYLTEQFETLSRLRDDEPEAWDEINELYFDD
jgi:hypothetical protein